MVCQMTPNAQHKRAERERRKAAGEARVEVWLSADDVAHLKDMIKHLGPGYGYADISSAIVRTLRAARGASSLT